MEAVWPSLLRVANSRSKHRRIARIRYSTTGRFDRYYRPLNTSDPTAAETADLAECHANLAAARASGVASNAFPARDNQGSGGSLAQNADANTYDHQMGGLGLNPSCDAMRCSFR